MLSSCIRISAAVVLLVGLAAIGGQPGAKNLPQPIVNTHEFMELFNQPLYKELRGLLSQQELNEKQLGSVEKHAYRLAEVANLIAIRKEAREHEQWQAMVAQLQHSALQLAEAAKQKKADDVLTAYKAVIKNCNDCHQSTEPDHAPQLAAFAKGGSS